MTRTGSAGVGQRVVSSWYHWTVFSPNLFLLAAKDATDRRLEAATLLLWCGFVQRVLT